MWCVPPAIGRKASSRRYPCSRPFPWKRSKRHAARARIFRAAGSSIACRTTGGNGSHDSAASRLHANHRHLSASRVAEIKAAGAWLFCYTVNEPARARDLLAWGVDAFCTDRIDLIGPDFAASR